MLQVAKSNVFCLVLLLGNLYAVQGDTAGSYQPTLCKTRTETEGEMGVMEFSISPKINMTTLSLIYLQRSNDPDINLLTCDAMENKSTIPCDVHNEQFTTEGFTGRTLTVRIPKRKHELDGEYELKAFVNGDSKVISTCNLTVVMKEAYSGAFESNSEVKIVVPIIVIVVVAVVMIIVIVLIRRRNRNKEGAFKATPENQQLNTTANTTGISENEADA
ncbi:uncharacterized protein [Littorina saxatilis]|uniref:Uncharacterized protein n=1 Tax=Littorina saxatilis TaxID=31220 RepID=A0AAN9GG29_9CAEN